MIERNCNALMALLISAVLWGAYGFQFIGHETPCTLCLLQRLGMLGISFGGLLNVKFGIQRAHYGLSLLSAFFGGFVALRHIALHVCQDDSPWKTFLGLNLYTWSFIVFSISILYISFLMIIFTNKRDNLKNKQINILGQLSFLSIGLLALANIFTTLHQCGLGDCEI